MLPPFIAQLLPPFPLHPFAFVHHHLIHRTSPATFTALFQSRLQHDQLPHSLGTTHLLTRPSASHMSCSHCHAGAFSFDPHAKHRRNAATQDENTTPLPSHSASNDHTLPLLVPRFACSCCSRTFHGRY